MINSSRSMNRDLDEGATDGKYKKRTPNREPIPRDAALERAERDQLTERYYDVEQADIMYRPDGQVARR